MPFYTWDQVTIQERGPGRTAQVLLAGKTQLARIKNTGPAAHEPHTHAENEQVSFVLAGQITFTVGQESRRVGPGGIVVIPPGVPHSTRVDRGDFADTLEVFCPPREDL